MARLEQRIMALVVQRMGRQQKKDEKLALHRP